VHELHDMFAAEFGHAGACWIRLHGNPTAFAVAARNRRPTGSRRPAKWEPCQKYDSRVRRRADRNVISGVTRGFYFVISWTGLSLFWLSGDEDAVAVRERGKQRPWGKAGLCCQCIELLCSGRIAPFAAPLHLALGNHIYELDAAQQDTRAAKVLESQQRSRQALDCLIARWSCSTMLFRYLTCRMVMGSSALMSCSASKLAELPSMVTESG